MAARAVFCKNFLGRKLFQKRFPLIALFLVIISTIPIYYFHRPWVDMKKIYADLMGVNISILLGHLSSDENCQIPILNPFDPALLKLVKPQPRIQCRKLQPDLFVLEGGTLRMNEAEWGVEGIRPDGVNCRYRCIEKNVEDVGFAGGMWVAINVSGDVRDAVSQPACDIVHVKCTTSATAFAYDVYQNIFYQIVPKSYHIHYDTPTFHANSANLSDSTVKPSDSDTKSNVIVIVIDSMSRSHFVRSLPKTYKYLVDEFGAFDFTGTMTVGVNTFPNIIPALTGKHAYRDRFPTGTNGPYDEWPLDWYNFSRHGYKTLYGEDLTKYNYFQSYGGQGFRRQPTDHYMRPLFQAVQELVPFRGATKFCHGSIPTHKLITNAVLDMFSAYKTAQPKYVHLHISDISHDDLNAVTSADDDFVEFLQNFRPYLKNSFFFMLGDHGLRFGKIRQSHLGQTEGGLPFFSMTPPDWFSSKFPKIHDIIKQNSNHRLITMLDFHATKMAILRQDWGFITPAGSGYPANLNHPFLSTTERGQSLFLPIPSDRTCELASVPEDFCFCEREIAIQVHHPKVLLAAESLVNHLNNLLMQSSFAHSRCAQLSLASIISATLALPNQRLSISDGSNSDQWGRLPDLWITLNLMISVYPSGGIFQARVRYLVISQNYEVSGMVSRANRYANQSHCVAQDRILVLYCFCNDQLAD